MDLSSKRANTSRAPEAMPSATPPPVSAALCRSGVCTGRVVLDVWNARLAGAGAGCGSHREASWDRSTACPSGAACRQNITTGTFCILVGLKEREHLMYDTFLRGLRGGAL